MKPGLVDSEYCMTIKPLSHPAYTLRQPTPCSVCFKDVSECLKDWPAKRELIWCCPQKAYFLLLLQIGWDFVKTLENNQTDPPDFQKMSL